MDRDELARNLEENTRWVEWALVELFKLQTETEQAYDMTGQHNGRGFCAMSAPFLSSMAKQVISRSDPCKRWYRAAGHRLSEKQYALARKWLPRFINNQLRHMPDPRTGGAK